METTELKKLASIFISESKLSESTKKQFFEFINNEATDIQIKSLLLDGKINKVDEQGKALLEKRFKISEAGGRIATMRKTFSSLHTAGLYLNDYKLGIDHLDFFKGEILRNPVALIYNGMCVADRVVIDHRGDPVFYDCLIIGRDHNDDLSVSYDPVLYVDDKVVQYIIILGIEELKF